jgi:hypothetical protein
MKTIIILTILIYCLCVESNAQTVNSVSCLPDSVEFLLDTSYTVTIFDVNIGTIDYQYSINGNHRDMIIDWTSLRDKNPNMSESAIRDFMVNALLRLFTFTDSSSQSDSNTINFYYKEDCLVEKTCTFQMYIPTPYPWKNCCEVFEDTTHVNNLIYTQTPWPDNFKFIDIKSKVYCGHKCCLDTYINIRTPDETRIYRQQEQGNGITLTNCPIENREHHCIKRNNNSGVVSPCTDEGCHQWK